MKIAIIGTYPPRRCGIGTFTHNLAKAIIQNTNDRNIAERIMIAAVTEDDAEYEYPEEVQIIIRQNQQNDYIRAANSINFSDADICILEHEFGIFGGDDGVYILPLLHRLKIPLIVTFHTVLKDPSYTQKLIVEEISRKAARIVVMSRLAVNFLTEIYRIPREKIMVIEHGVPEMEGISHRKAKSRFGLDGKKVLLTFGLLSRNKGIETVLHSLPEVQKKYGNFLYIVLGATHPNVLKHSGEEYRNSLQRLVKQYNLENHVYFVNEFVSEEKLFEYLSAADIYITPYLSEAQITSGTLTYAIGAGCAVVSTPYWHAKELLDEGRGKLFEFRNSQQLSSILLELLQDDEKLVTLREKAYEYGKKLRWPRIAKQYLYLAEYVFDNWQKVPETEVQPIDLPLLPDYDISHIKRLTDDTGIVQHAKYGIPNLKEGYCLDDNARALLMALMAWRQNRDRDALELMPVYLSFINYMQREDGNFRNLLSFSRQFLDEYGSEDSFGRTIWALGYLIRFAPNDAFKQMGREIFFRSVQHFDKLNSPRGMANTLIGISYYLKDAPNDEGMIHIMRRLANRLTDLYHQNRKNDWHWFEETMTYDNAILPMALFCSYEICGDQEMLDAAMEATRFLESVTFRHGYFAPVGNKDWYTRGGNVPEFDQQSVDVMAMVLLYYQVFQVTRDRKYIEKLFTCYLWFLGENSLRLPLFDHETKGCCDGLEVQGLNRNQGAESSLAYWISHLTVLAAQEKEHLYLQK